jgi:hypothetical protein
MTQITTSILVEHVDTAQAQQMADALLDQGYALVDTDVEPISWEISDPYISRIGPMVSFRVTFEIGAGEDAAREVAGELLQCGYEQGDVYADMPEGAAISWTEPRGPSDVESEYKWLLSAEPDAADIAKIEGAVVTHAAGCIVLEVPEGTELPESIARLIVPETVDETGAANADAFGL